MTLRTRLGIAAALVGAVMVAAGVQLPRTVRASEIQQVDRQLAASLPIAIGITADARPPLSDRPALQQSAPAFSQVYVARVTAGNRVVLARPQVIADREPELPAASVLAGRGRVAPTTVGSVHGGGSWRAVLLEEPGGNRVLVAVSLDSVAATARRMTAAVALAGLAMLIALALAAWWLLRLGLRPIAEVTAVADAIAAGDRSRRVGEAASGTEAAHLARAFNVMLDEQQSTEERLRQFIADASHELRTPVTAIGGFADLWRQGALEPAQIDEVMRRIGQESGRMRGLVEDLLLLARLDDGQQAATAPVDLLAVARDAVLDASATHPSRPIGLDAPEAVVVAGVDAQLRQVVANLLTNALTHAGPTASVGIRLQRRGNTAALSVVDDGPGMSAEQSAHAFDRFWRGDAARHGGGSGLGLAIVRGIVTAHGGEVEILSTAGAGTTVRVLLPV